MESANSHHQHHHHQLQDQLVGSSSSSSPSSSSCFELGTTTHAWSTPFSSILNNNNGFITSYPNSDTILSSRETRQQQDQNPHHLSSQYSSTMPPDLGFYWSNDHNFLATNHHQSLQGNLQNSRIKEELSSDHYYRNYVDILSSSTSPSSRNNNNTTTADELSLMQRNDIDEQSNDYLGTKLLLKSFSSGNLMNKNSSAQISPQDLYSNYNNGAANINGRGFSSQIFPSVNVSNLSSQNGFTNPSSLDMNLEALDLLTSSRFSSDFGGASQNQTGILRDGGFSYGFDHHLQQQSHQTTPFYGSSTTKVSSVSSNGAVETKRSSSRIDQPKAPNAPKKSRLEARASCPPFKVRKEKLGDRIAALQQLVAPFGKTDTASVLMEAIGYIKFLQSQVETLSVPYMKASRNKSIRVMKGGPVVENENEEQRRDLKSRGLCLVPLSCLSYMTDGDGGAAVWPPPHFGGAT